MENIEKVLKSIMAKVPVNKSGNFDLRTLCEENGIGINELNKILDALDSQRYITDFPVAGNNIKINVNEKALTFNFTC